MVHWHPVPVANQLLILIIKLATYLVITILGIAITVCQSLVVLEFLHN